MPIFGHSEFIPIFFGNIVRKNLEQSFLAILNLYHSFWENCQKKFGTAILAILNLYQSFWEKLSEKIRNAILAIPNLYQSFWENLSEKILNGHFWPFQIYTSLLGKNCQKKFRTAIFCTYHFNRV